MPTRLRVFFMLALGGGFSYRGTRHWRPALPPTEGVRVGGVCARTEPVAPSRECRKTFFEEAADLVEKRQRQKRRGREREISLGRSGRGGSSRRRTGTGRARPMNDWTCQQEGEGGKRRKNRSNSVELWIGYQSIYHS